MTERLNRLVPWGILVCGVLWFVQGILAVGIVPPWAEFALAAGYAFLSGLYLGFDYEEAA